LLFVQKTVGIPTPEGYRAMSDFFTKRGRLPLWRISNV